MDQTTQVKVDKALATLQEAHCQVSGAVKGMTWLGDAKLRPGPTCPRPRLTQGCSEFWSGSTQKALLTSSASCSSGHDIQQCNRVYDTNCGLCLSLCFRRSSAQTPGKLKQSFHLSPLSVPSLLLGSRTNSVGCSLLLQSRNLGFVCPAVWKWITDKYN